MEETRGCPHGQHDHAGGGRHRQRLRRRAPLPGSGAGTRHRPVRGDHAGRRPAWLLWPDSENWSDGEINFPEGELGGEVFAFMHHRGRPDEQDWFATRAGLSDWHTAVIEWTPRRVRFLLDDAVVGVSKDPALIP